MTRTRFLRIATFRHLSVKQKQVGCNSFSPWSAARSGKMRSWGVRTRTAGLLQCSSFPGASIITRTHCYRCWSRAAGGAKGARPGGGPFGGEARWRLECLLGLGRGGEAGLPNPPHHHHPRAALRPSVARVPPCAGPARGGLARRVARRRTAFTAGPRSIAPESEPFFTYEPARMISLAHLPAEPPARGERVPLASREHRGQPGGHGRRAVKELRVFTFTGRQVCLQSNRVRFARQLPYGDGSATDSDNRSSG